MVLGCDFLYIQDNKPKLKNSQTSPEECSELRPTFLSRKVRCLGLKNNNFCVFNLLCFVNIMVSICILIYIPVTKT